MKKHSRGGKNGYLFMRDIVNKRIIWFTFSIVVFLLLAMQAWMLRNWIIDDAAISMSYARNLWYGNGLISQYGAPAVEGFSDPLWVLILSPFTEFLNIVSIAKCISLVMVFIAAMRFANTVAKIGNTWLGFLAAILLVLQPSITIWTQSGLENALTLMLGVELLIYLQKASCGNLSKKLAIQAGVVSAALALTRPEGIVYAALYPLLVILLLRQQRVGKYQTFLIAAAIPFAVAAMYELFRWMYFDALVPNTYLAKGGVTTARISALLALDPYVLQIWQDIFRSVFGYAGQTWAVLILLWSTVSIFRGRNRTLVIPSIMMLFVSLLLIVLLPSDWMPENRLATLVYPPFYLLIVLAIWHINNKKLAILISLGLVLLGVWQSSSRLQEFLDQPTISKDEVEDRSRIFEQWGKLLSKSRPTILTADVGGILWRDKIEVVDLGMLVNRPIAKSLGEYRPTPDRNSFHKYIFEEARPDFIATRAYHAWLADLDGDPRFRRDYIPIREYIDTWVLQRKGIEVYAGDYVKRSLADAHPKEFAQIRHEATKIDYPFCVNDHPI
jgi:hypothetical protein